MILPNILIMILHLGSGATTTITAEFASARACYEAQSAIKESIKHNPRLGVLYTGCHAK